MARSSCQKNSTSTWCSARRTARLCSSREESLSSEGGWEGGWEVTRGLYRLLPNSAPPPAGAAVIRSAAAPFRPPSAQRPPLVLMSGIVAVISHTDGTCLCVGTLRLALGRGAEIGWLGPNIGSSCPYGDSSVMEQITVLHMIDGDLPQLLDSVGKRLVSRDGHTGVTATA